MFCLVPLLHISDGETVVSGKDVKKFANILDNPSLDDRKVVLL